MSKCNKDCLNCKLSVCIHDLEDANRSNKYEIIRGKTIGLNARLAMIMKVRKYTQKRLAIETGITAPTISAYMNDLRVPRADHIVSICKVLHISADWLLGMEE